jgi:CYTH domain-containing protein
MGERMGEGHWEIERRYLVRVDPAIWARLGEGHHFRQGYVRTGSRAVRIRTGEPRGAVLTLKSGKGVRRREVETIVCPEVAEGLLEASGRRVIEKVRHRIGPWELDRFEGALEGLVLLEIELEDEDDPVPGPPDGVTVIREVTDDKRFTNSVLASLTQNEQRRMVADFLARGDV